MPKFGRRSQVELSTCDPRLQDIFETVIEHIDCSVLEGYRDESDQDKLFAQGKSKLRGGQSKHNYHPSQAVDVAPYPIDWDDLERFRRFAHFVMGVAVGMGITLRWGGDWDRDWDLSDNRFNDLPHFEIVED